MVLDTSAIFAILAGEPEADRVREAILSANTLAISAVTALETRIVLQGRLGLAVVGLFDERIAETDVVIVPFDLDQAAVAFEAIRCYGHWRCDTGFAEDTSRVRSGKAPQALASLHNTVLCLLRPFPVSTCATW